MNLHTPSHSHDGNIFGSTKLIPTKEAVLWKCSRKINNFYSHYNMLQDTTHPACWFSYTVGTTTDTRIVQTSHLSRSDY